MKNMMFYKHMESDDDGSREIRMLKEGDIHKVYYRNGEEYGEYDINHDSFSNIFQYLRPNNTLSSPDMIIQKYNKNNLMVPSFLNNHNYTNNDFNETLNPIRKHMKNIISMNQRDKQENRKRKYLNHMTRKVNRSTTERRKRSLLRKLNPRRKQRKTSKDKPRLPNQNRKKPKSKRPKKKT